MCSSSPCRSFVYVAADVLFSVVMDMIFMLQAGWGGSAALSGQRLPVYPTLNQLLFSFLPLFLPSPPLPSLMPSSSPPLPSPPLLQATAVRLIPVLGPPLSVLHQVFLISLYAFEYRCYSEGAPVCGWVGAFMCACVYACVCVCVCVCVRTCMCQCGKTDSITSQNYTSSLSCTDPKSFLFRFRV